jgi:hypothetical protein
MIGPPGHDKSRAKCNEHVHVHIDIGKPSIEAGERDEIPKE